MIAEDKNAGNESVTPEPVKGVAMSEEARPLPLIMSHSNNKKIYICIWWPTKIRIKEKMKMFYQTRPRRW